MTIKFNGKDKKQNKIMETQDIKTGRELNLTLELLQEKLKGRVYQYKCAGKCLYDTGIYKRGRTQNIKPIEGLRGTIDIYILTDTGEIILLLYNTKPHRARKALDTYQNKQLKNVHPDVWQNYITNGYKTRKGLLFNYSAREIERIGEIAKSHANYLGNEKNSSLDHENRKRMRNK